MIHGFEDVAIKDWLDMDCLVGGYKLLNDDTIIERITEKNMKWLNILLKKKIIYPHK